MSRSARAPLAALATGMLFGLGLIISGMADPAKVQNFLDVAGTWDPSLAFVMGGAIAVTMPGFALLRKRGAPWFAESFRWPTASDIDLRLIAGAALFGAGWGLGGFCPGPALTALPLAATGTFVFVLAMLTGFVLAKRWVLHRDARQSISGGNGTSESTRSDNPA